MRVNLVKLWKKHFSRLLANIKGVLTARILLVILSKNHRSPKFTPSQYLILYDT